MLSSHVVALKRKKILKWSNVTYQVTGLADAKVLLPMRRNTFQSVNLIVALRFYSTAAVDGISNAAAHATTTR